MKIKIQPFSSEWPYDKPATEYAHLEPIVDALIEDGNGLTINTKFHMTRDGWRCDLKGPINFDLLKDMFDFPKSIELLEEEDAIVCRKSWIEIKGPRRE